MIGIFIGIAAVVALISLGQGLQNAITEQFEQLGSDKIIIMPKTLGPPGSATSQSLMLTDKDLNVIENTRGVSSVIGILMKTTLVKFKDESSVNYVMGIDTNNVQKINDLMNVEVIEGRDLKQGDEYKAVVGYNHAYGSIWTKDIQLRDTISIEGQEFKVIGILKKIGNPYDDASVYISKDTLKNILNTGDEESEIIAQSAPGYDPAKVAEDVKRELRQYRNEEEDQETFSVQTSDQLLETFSSIFGIVQAVLVGIAGISLVVGGIGIMNTMYTAVMERTKEIGTMKAVGAKNSDILFIFLIEAGLLGLVGGLIGVGIGYALGQAAQYIASQALGTDLLKADTSLTLILGSLAFSFVIGAASGIFPAMQASRLKPAEALRHE
jgi:putative ABC transport system permease protein